SPTFTDISRAMSPPRLWPVASGRYGPAGAGSRRCDARIVFLMFRVSILVEHYTFRHAAPALRQNTRTRPKFNQPRPADAHLCPHLALSWIGSSVRESSTD